MMKVYSDTNNNHHTNNKWNECKNYSRLKETQTLLVFYGKTGSCTIPLMTVVPLQNHHGNIHLAEELSYTYKKLSVFFYIYFPFITSILWPKFIITI